jgi:hypothetical protein
MTMIARLFLPPRLLAFSAAALLLLSLALLTACSSRCNFAITLPYLPSYYAIDWTTTMPLLQGEGYVDNGFITLYFYTEDSTRGSFGIFCNGDNDDGNDDGDDDRDNHCTGGAIARAIACLSLCASAIVSLALSASMIGIATAFWYGASQCRAQSNAVNLILRLFLYHFLYAMSL